MAKPIWPRNRQCSSLIEEDVSLWFKIFCQIDKKSQFKKSLFDFEVKVYKNFKKHLLLQMCHFLGTSCHFVILNLKFIHVFFDRMLQSCSQLLIQQITFFEKNVPFDKITTKMCFIQK